MTIFPTLYISHPWLIYFATVSLYLLISLTYFFPALTPLPSGNHLFVLGIYTSVSVLLCLFICFVFLESTYKWNHTVYVWLISLSRTPPRSIRVVANGKKQDTEEGWIQTPEVFGIMKSGIQHTGCTVILEEKFDSPAFSYIKQWKTPKSLLSIFVWLYIFWLIKLDNYVC